jgi:hypothetical protein
MAFNPLTNFQKYRKFWMASVLLICMVTFVLCTGVGGDLSDRLLRIFYPRGSVMATINDRSYYSKDLENLKTQRDAADAFMRKATEFSLIKIGERIKKEEQNKDTQERKILLMRLTKLKAELAERHARQRYFNTGTRLEDLVDFLLWRDEADKRNINLEPKDVNDLVLYAVHGHSTGFDSATSREVEREVRYKHNLQSDTIIMQAVTDEFRVQIAKYALTGGRRFDAISMLFGDSRGTGPSASSRLDYAVRLPMSPAQLYEYFQKKRAEVEVALIPIPVTDFFPDVKVPTGQDKEEQQRFETQLQEFFDKHKDKRYNPTTEEPGFLLPAEVQVAWVSADPKSDYYQDIARRYTTLATTPPLPPPPLPLGGAWVNTVSYYPGAIAAKDGILYRDRYKDALESEETKFRQSARAHARKYIVPPLTDPYYLFHFYRPEPAEVLAMLGAPAAPGGVLAAPGVYGAAVFSRNEKKWGEAIAVEKKLRSEKLLHLAANTFLGGASREPYAVVGTWVQLGRNPLFEKFQDRVKHLVELQGGVLTQDVINTLVAWDLSNFQPRPRYLPMLGPVKEDMLKQEHDKIAIAVARQTMQKVKEALEKDNVKGNERLFWRSLGELQRDYRDVAGNTGLQYGAMKKLRTQYDLDAEDAQLKPLRLAFEEYLDKINSTEGRVGPKRLKEDDFYTLFFGSETYGIGNKGKFQPGVWPPTLTPKSHPGELVTGDELKKQVVLYTTADQSFLFWKINDKTAMAPEKMNDHIRPLVLEAWKLKEARAKLLAQLPKITDELLKELEGKDVRTVVRSYAKKLGEDAARKAAPDKKPADAAKVKEGEKDKKPIEGETKPAAKDRQPVMLYHVAPLVEMDLKGANLPKAFVPYELPRGKVPYPRDDMSKHLLDIKEVKEAIEIKDLVESKESTATVLNNLNKKLFKDNKLGGGRVLQVLTNRPKTVYYLVVVVSDPAGAKAQDFEFYEAYLHVPTVQSSASQANNLLIEQAQMDSGEAFLRELVRILNRHAAVEDSARKTFGSESSGDR